MSDPAKKESGQSALVVTLTQEDLRALIGAEVRAALSSANANAVQPSLLTLDQIAKELEVSTKTVTTLARTLGMPYARPGAESRFDLAEVREWARKARPRAKRLEK